MKTNIKNIKSIIKLLPVIILLLIFGTLQVQAEEKEDLNIKDLIFEHLGDSYKWHFFTWGEKDVSLYLPVIVRSEKGSWHVFSSSRLEKGASYEGFYVAHEGDYKHKIVEKSSSGAEVRPWDFSITKNVLAMIVSIIIMLASIMSLAKWYKGGRLKPPGGFLAMVEILVINIQEEVIKPCIGEGYEKYSNFLLTTFFFILINNLMGLIPLFPGGANVTGNIAITFFLSFITFLLININGNKHYWKEIFWPEVPTWLKFPVPLMPVMEFWGVLMKPAALMIRLFANVMAGHSMILGLICLIFISVKMGVIANISMSAVAIVFSIFISFIELMVSVIQAYVFVLLSAVFIGMSRVKERHVEEDIHVE